VFKELIYGIWAMKVLKLECWTFMAFSMSVAKKIKQKGGIRIMHIPDGYLSLQTSLPALGVMVPIWSAAINKVKKVLSLRQIPLLSLCAAFSFVIMMFNVPLGASSVHAVGAVFIAILMGPWASCIAVSIALIIQALIFGDGGVLAIGANCFNMAFVMPFAGYYIYKAIAGDSKVLSRRSLTGVFAGSYIGLNAAAFLTSVEFGIQPLLFKTAEGTPLYGFYPLSVSIPAIMLEHLLVAGIVEGVVTVAAVAYVAKFSPQLFDRAAVMSEAVERASLFYRYKALIIGLLAMIVLAPVGLIATGTAWGEWGVEEVKEMVGYIPRGLEKFSAIWNSLIPDYSIPGLDGSFLQSSVGYIASAIIGIAVISVVMLLSSRLISKKEDSHNRVES